jgi:MFS family permease
MTSNLVLRSVGRVLWFAVAGALCMALVGVVAGSVTGALIVIIDHLPRSRPLADVFDYYVGMGAIFGALRAMNVGLWSGAIAFGIAGYFACFSALPQKVFARSFRLAWRAMVVGVTVGAVLGPINFLMLRQFTSNILTDPFSGYMYGVIGGFIIGIFYGAIVGARREIARQKLEQNAPLSTTESGA